VLTENYDFLKKKTTIKDLERMKISKVFDKIIELDNSINYIRPVFANSLSMFPDINPEHEFIQFETGSKEDKSDLAFICDLFSKQCVKTLD
jgi:hypothetical protein